jgi:uncharacterized protein YegP (UPF0339 family)
MFHVELVRNKNKKWFFRIKSGNGQILCHSEEYTRKSSAKRIANSLHNNLRNSGMYLIEVK